MRATNIHRKCDMREYDPEGFGKRLSDEMGRAGIKDAQALQKRLDREAPPNTRGTSYTAVLQYVKGLWPSEPRREVVETLARMFDPRMRPEYLLYEGEPRTETDMEAGRRGESAVRPERHEPAATVFRSNLPGSGTRTHWPGPGPAAEAVLWRLWAPLMGATVEARPDGAGPIDEEAIGVACAEQIVRALLAPLKEMDALPPRMLEPGRLQADSQMSFRARMSGPYLDDYIIAACEALRPVVQRQANAISEERWRRDVENETPKED